MSGARKRRGCFGESTHPGAEDLDPRRLRILKSDSRSTHPGLAEAMNGARRNAHPHSSVVGGTGAVRCLERNDLDF